MAAQWPTRANMTLLVGCDSCGTSALAEALGDFRGAVLPSGDEGGPSYFSAEDRYARQRLVPQSLFAAVASGNAN